MKNFNIKILLWVFISLLFTTSCNDYLNITPDDATTKSFDDIFAERSYAERFLATTYAYLPRETNFNDNSGFNPFVGSSDEMNVTWTYTLSNKINMGAWNPVVVEQNGTAHWREFWVPIRQANEFLENIEKTPMDDAERNAWIGEAHFLRGFFHFLLLRLHGPIPLMETAVKVDDDFADFKRQPFDQCVDFIVSECDKAIQSNIPIVYTNSQNSVDFAKYGRATKAAALALKARVLLYAASPLFNGNPDYASFSNLDGTPLFSPKDDSKWQKAADAAKQCIDQVEGSGHYGLYYSSTGDPMQSYSELFRRNWNREILFAKNRGQGDDNNWHHEHCLSPNGMGGWSGLCPTQDLVDAYQMADGSTPIVGYESDGAPIINPESGYSEKGFSFATGKYHPSNISKMYINREPRFYASINFSGQKWRGRKIEFFYTGRDGARISSTDYTSTGYLMRKTSDEGVNIPQNTGYSRETWIFFRLGEIYLNYAEALNEAQGAVGDVYKYVNLIRERAGLPNLPSGLSKEDMREKIRHERRIELAFETHRYFDCHRWKIAEDTDNGAIYGLNITGGSYAADPSFYKRKVVEKRVFEKKHYLWPIPQTEIEKMRNLVQSPYWQN